MDNEQLIKDLVKQGESEQLEFKEAVRKGEIAKTICSFLNASGGRVLVGVKSNREVVGVEMAEQNKDELESFLINAIVPEAPITTTIETYGEKRLLMVKVYKGSKQPYLYDGSIFFRRGAQTTKATSNEISGLIHNRQTAELHWERQPAVGVDLDDLDIPLIQETVEEVKRKGLGGGYSPDLIEFLSNYGLYQNGNVTNAAVVLFAKNPSRYLPQCRTRIVVMPEGKTGNEYKNSVLLEGNLFSTFKEIQSFFKTNVELNSSFSGSEWQRLDHRKYPLDALDEGVMNALIHRDYSNPSGSVLISIYPEKLEIANFGTLPEGLKISDLKKNHLSLPRNPDIAHVCYLKGWIEKLGRGTLMIVERAKQAGLKAPQWSVSGGTTTLTFYSGGYSRKQDVSVGELNARQLNILEKVMEGEQTTVPELVNLFNGAVSDRSIRTDLNLLIEGGWFEKKGRGRNTHYVRLK